MSEKTSWVIGAAPECDLVIDAPPVSGRHCRLTLDAGVWLLEDLSSTNGTFVNGRQIEKPTNVSRGDRVTLGQNTPMPWPDLKDVASPAFSSRFGTKQAVLAAAAVALLAALVVMIWNSRDNQSSEPDGKVTAKTKKKVSDPKKPVTPPPKPKPEQALFIVLVSDKDQSLTMRLGTAFAVSPRHLVTTAEIVKNIQRMSGKYSVVSIYCPATKRQLTVDTNRVRIHPQYEELFGEEQRVKRQIAELRVKIDEVLDRLERGNDGNSKRKGKKPATTATKPNAASAKRDTENLRKHGESLKDLDGRFAQLKEEQRFYDLAVLEVDHRLKQHLPVASQNIRLFANTPVSIRGIPFPTTQFVERDSQDRTRLHAAVLSSDIRQLPRLAGRNVEIDRLVVQSKSVRLARSGGTESPQTADFQWWVGSPVLNPDGEVVGVYSRLMPADKPDDPPGGKYHDVTRIARLWDFAADVLTVPSQKSRSK